MPGSLMTPIGSPTKQLECPTRLLESPTRPLQSPTRRSQTSLGHYIEYRSPQGQQNGNSYDVELYNRQLSSRSPHHFLHGKTATLRPKTAILKNTVHAPVERCPSTTNYQYRPPSRCSRTPDHMYSSCVYNEQDDWMREHMIPSPEPITVREDDGQIFVRKPKRRTPPSAPIFRLGNHGAPWRHIQSVISSNGSHICWVNGTVKQEENMFYPPWACHDTDQVYPPRLMPRPQTSKPILSGTKYNSRPRHGYKYWY